MVEFPGGNIRKWFGPRAILGSLAGGSLFVGASPRRLLSSLTSTTPVSSDGYVAEVLEAIAIIGTNTLVGPVLETVLTSLLVVGVMYEAFDLAEIRETAPLYTTWQFRLLVALLSGGFGLVLIGLTQRYVGFLVWLFVVVAVLFVFMYRKTDPASLENPAVTLNAKTSGHDTEDYRRRIAREGLPVRYSVPVLILAAAAVFSGLAMALGFVVYIATILYPLPEVLVLVWVFAQVTGAGSLPIIGRIADTSIEDVGIEGRLFTELGSTTSSRYALILAVYYLTVLMVSAVVFSGLLVISLYFLVFNASSIWIEFTGSAGSVSAVLYLIVAVIGLLVATGYFFLYWLVQILRLPGVAERELGGGDATVNPRYRRMEGLTLPAAALLVWIPFSTHFLYGYQTAPSMTQWTGALTVNFVLIMSCGWTVYRFRWSGLNPQTVENEEWIALVASTVTTGSMFFVNSLATPIPVAQAVGLPVSVVLIIGSILYYIRRERTTDLSKQVSVKKNLLLWSAVVVGASIIYWVTTVSLVVLSMLVTPLTLLIIVERATNRIYADSSESGGDV
jgi:hypothetical protein